MSPGGKFNVMLPCTSSPYFKYPKNPIAVYKQATMTIPVFKTPVVPPKSSGVRILFSSGRTTPIPSNAYIAVPKYNGRVAHDATGFTVLLFGRSCKRYINVITSPTNVITAANNDTGVRYFKFRTKFNKIIGTKRIKRYAFTSQLIDG